MATHFVLDNNFPVLALGAPWPRSVRVTDLKTIDARLISGFEDWQVLLALHQRGDVDAFVTLDGRILKTPTAVVLMPRIQVSVVVAEGAGNNPLRATGMLMAGIERVAERIASEGPRIWTLKMSVTPTSPQDQLNRVAAWQRMTPRELIDREEAVIGEISVPVLQ